MLSRMHHMADSDPEEDIPLMIIPKDSLPSPDINRRLRNHHVSNHYLSSDRSRVSSGGSDQSSSDQTRDTMDSVSSSPVEVMHVDSCPNSPDTSCRTASSSISNSSDEHTLLKLRQPRESFGCPEMMLPIDNDDCVDNGNALRGCSSSSSELISVRTSSDASQDSNEMRLDDENRSLEKARQNGHTISENSVMCDLYQEEDHFSSDHSSDYEFGPRCKTQQGTPPTNGSLDSSEIEREESEATQQSKCSIKGDIDKSTRSYHSPQGTIVEMNLSSVSNEMLEHSYYYPQDTSLGNSHSSSQSTNIHDRQNHQKTTAYQHPSPLIEFTSLFSQHAATATPVPYHQQQPSIPMTGQTKTPHLNENNISANGYKFQIPQDQHMYQTDATSSPPPLLNPLTPLYCPSSVYGLPCSSLENDQISAANSRVFALDQAAYPPSAANTVNAFAMFYPNADVTHLNGNPSSLTTRQPYMDPSPYPFHGMVFLPCANPYYVLKSPYDPANPRVGKQPCGDANPYVGKQPCDDAKPYVNRPPWDGANPYVNRPPCDGANPYVNRPHCDDANPYVNRPHCDDANPYVNRPPCNGANPYVNKPPCNGVNPYVVKPPCDDHNSTGSIQQTTEASSPPPACGESQSQKQCPNVVHMPSADFPTNYKPSPSMDETRKVTRLPCHKPSPPNHQTMPYLQVMVPQYQPIISPDRLENTKNHVLQIQPSSLTPAPVSNSSNEGTMGSNKSSILNVDSNNCTQISSGSLNTRVANSQGSRAEVQHPVALQVNLPVLLLPPTPTPTLNDNQNPVSSAVTQLESDNGQIKGMQTNVQVQCHNQSDHVNVNMSPDLGVDIALTSGTAGNKTDDYNSLIDGGSFHPGDVIRVQERSFQHDYLSEMTPLTPLTGDSLSVTPSDSGESKTNGCCKKNMFTGFHLKCSRPKNVFKCGIRDHRTPDYMFFCLVAILVNPLIGIFALLTNSLAKRYHRRQLYNYAQNFYMATLVLGSLSVYTFITVIGLFTLLLPRSQFDLVDKTTDCNIFYPQDYDIMQFYNMDEARYCQVMKNDVVSKALMYFYSFTPDSNKTKVKHAGKNKGKNASRDSGDQDTSSNSTLTTDKHGPPQNQSIPGGDTIKKKKQSSYVVPSSTKGKTYSRGRPGGRDVIRKGGTNIPPEVQASMDKQKVGNIILPKVQPSMDKQGGKEKKRSGQNLATTSTLKATNDGVSSLPPKSASVPTIPGNFVSTTTSKTGPSLAVTVDDTITDASSVSTDETISEDSMLYPEDPEIELKPTDNVSTRSDSSSSGKIHTRSMTSASPLETTTPVDGSSSKIRRPSGNRQRRRRSCPFK